MGAPAEIDQEKMLEQFVAAEQKVAALLVQAAEIGARIRESAELQGLFDWLAAVEGSLVPAWGPDENGHEVSVGYAAAVPHDGDHLVFVGATPVEAIEAAMRGMNERAH